MKFFKHDSKFLFLIFPSLLWSVSSFHNSGTPNFFISVFCHYSLVLDLGTSFTDHPTSVLPYVDDSLREIFHSLFVGLVEENGRTEDGDRE